MTDAPPHPDSEHPDLAHPDIARALRWFGKPFEALSERERRVLDRARDRRTVSRDPAACDADMTFGQRIADRVAQFGGSWTFIIGFGCFLAVWTLGNLALRHAAFDGYPFIFLNLILSMLAAVQAPVILMSQNRQSVKDRQDAAHDYEVNLKAEIEIMALHEKLDELRSRDIEAMLKKQEEQIALLTRLIEQRPA